jgi:hypothetical protein
MGLPPGTADNDIALGELRDMRVNYFADRASFHNIANSNRFGIGRRITHPAPHGKNNPLDGFGQPHSFKW